MGISWRAERLGPFATPVSPWSVLWILLEPRWLGLGTVSFLTGFVLGAFAGDLALPL
jgi:hypothetical protein